ncbi:hypothetical protein E2C01_034331 [Portunus trituberculatus]|uniref:Uncharacterized protein n=1 Tax=Portunus trituberculatus TaxID=210409 RepID=A0A5B7F890_PORTR|nr:hypothetical protein [Portunus trituberculatus]
MTPEDPNSTLPSRPHLFPRRGTTCYLAPQGPMGTRLCDVMTLEEEGASSKEGRVRTTEKTGIKKARKLARK